MRRKILPAPSSSSATRVLGRWMISADSTSMPASASAARTVATSAGSVTTSNTSLVDGGCPPRPLRSPAAGRPRSSAGRPRRACPSCRRGRRRSPGSPSEPPCLVNAWRMSAPVRFAVVRDRLYEDRDAARPVALVHDGLERGGVGARAGALGDRALDVVLGHGRVARLLDREAQRGVALDRAAAVLGRDRDRAGQLRERLAAARVDDRLLVLDRRPFRMTRHVASAYPRGAAAVDRSRHGDRREQDEEGIERGAVARGYRGRAATVRSAGGERARATTAGGLRRAVTRSAAPASASASTSQAPARDEPGEPTAGRPSRRRRWRVGDGLPARLKRPQRRERHDPPRRRAGCSRAKPRPVASRRSLSATSSRRGLRNRGPQRGGEVRGPPGGPIARVGERRRVVHARQDVAALSERPGRTRAAYGRCARSRAQ